MIYKDHQIPPSDSKQEEFQDRDLLKLKFRPGNVSLPQSSWGDDALRHIAAHRIELVQRTCLGASLERFAGPDVIVSEHRCPRKL